MDAEKVRKVAYKHALRDKALYGKVSLKSVMGKVIGEMPEVKERLKELIGVIREVAEKVEGMSMEEVKKEMAQFSYEKPKKDERIWIENPMEGVVTRFPPEPSGYLHIGHAKAAFLNEKIAEDYKGKVLLRFDDTNPKKESWEYVEAIREDLDWLGFSPSGESFTSDYIERLYSTAKGLIERGKAYVALSPPEEIRQARQEGRPLKDRERSVEENLELFERMLENAFGEGEAVLLYKGRPDHPNTAMRDPTLMRVVEGEHYRVGDKYGVWPTYDMAVPFVDSWEGVTHAIRSKEYELRKELYYALLDHMGERKPTLMHFSRLNIRGVPLSKRILRELVERGIVKGWDDPRMPTIRGLRRRGIQPEAIKAFALRFGIGKQEKVVDWSMLEKENRKVLDGRAKRLLGVEEPTPVEVAGGVNAVVPYHPEKDLGKREVKGRVVLLNKREWEGVREGETVILRHLGPFVREGNMLRRVEGRREGKLLFWAPEGSRAVRIIIPNPLLDEEGKIIEEYGKER